MVEIKGEYWELYIFRFAEEHDEMSKSVVEGGANEELREGKS